MTCEATVAIVVNAVERKLKLDHELVTIPILLSRVSTGNRGCGFHADRLDSQPDSH